MKAFNLPGNAKRRYLTRPHEFADVVEHESFHQGVGSMHAEFHFINFFNKNLINQLDRSHPAYHDLYNRMATCISVAEDSGNVCRSGGLALEFLRELSPLVWIGFF